MKEKNTGVLRLVLRVLQGMLIGVGAVLPGISGGVLCVVFGIYKPIMELLSSPIKKWKTHVPRLLPVIVGAVLGFLGVAKVLAFFLERYPDQSVCLFVGLIAGMLPSLFREAGEQGRTRGSWISLVAAFAVVLALLPGPPQMMVRNLLYTAVTRAKQRVVMVGSEGVLRRMVENDKTAHRYSALGERLQALDRLRAIGEGEP